MSDHPQADHERRHAARHLLQRPLTCKEHDPDIFRLIRRHGADLDRWFTQRLGYRLHVDADSARLYKAGALPGHRPLRTASGRAFHHMEYVLLALVLASTAAGPAVISLRDLVEQVRLAAVEADIELSDTSSERRALVAVLQWMIAAGLAEELHARVELYSTDDTADAVIRVRPDRIALLPLPALLGATSATELLSRADRRDASRQWMRSRLVEEPVLYRDDLTDAEWTELRRRTSQEEAYLDEMFGLLLEVRSEGIAAIDPTGSLASRRFPTGGTVGHAALLLLDRLGHGSDDGGDGDTDRRFAMDDVAAVVAELAGAHARRWANDLVETPDRLTRQVLDLLVELRLVAISADDGGSWVTILPAAARFLPTDPTEAEATVAQGSMW
ncbi:MAG: TIGR02678 family protein [Acidimicrobiia bacterium]|nr:TIGR02678 family protein [Acidimicrobiia bacterium]